MTKLAKGQKPLLLLALLAAGLASREAAAQYTRARRAT
jgi:hypothetical protein